MIDEAPEPEAAASDQGDRPRQPDPAGPFSRRWSRVAGLVLLVYIVATMVRIALLQVDTELFTTVTGWTGSLGYRLFVCLALVALLWHGVSGLRVVVLETSVGARRHDDWIRGASLFVTIALAIPGSVVILRPWIEGTLL